MDMSGSGSGMAPGPSCKISMLWNWYVEDSCFIARSWHISSKGMFAGSCIGVVFLVVALEFLRRSVKEYDRLLIKQHVANFQKTPAFLNGTKTNSNVNNGEGGSVNGQSCAVVPPFRPNVLQQAVRALLHMLQFAVAYFVMLLAMYYNGYIIICIFIGAYLGAFIFHWEPLTVGGQQTSAAAEATVCCG